MPDQNLINSSSESIAGLVDKARAELVSQLYDLGKDIDNPSLFAEALLDIDIEGTLKSKLKKATSVYANAHRGVLESTVGFSDINSKTLLTFVELNEQLFDDAIISTISGQIRSQLSNGLQVGLSVNEIVEEVINASISNAQMQTLINTTLNTYSRQITNQMMETAPDDTLYWYIGPVDGKTRDICVRYVSKGKVTKKEIQGLDRGDYSLSYGGGFNCRHKWEVAGKVSEFHQPKKATKFRKEKGLPDATVVTKED
tara:strand:- start:78 stop:845 length:768 start_codon:yes stop_codon:yes gene_type:complete